MAMEPEAEVKVGGVTAGWVEYDPDTDRWQARVKGDSAPQPFPYRARAVAWIREQHEERRQ